MSYSKFTHKSPSPSCLLPPMILSLSQMLRSQRVHDTKNSFLALLPAGTRAGVIELLNTSTFDTPFPGCCHDYRSPRDQFCFFFHVAHPPRSLVRIACPCVGSTWSNNYHPHIFTRIKNHHLPTIYPFSKHSLSFCLLPFRVSPVKLNAACCAPSAQVRTIPQLLVSLR